MEVMMMDIILKSIDVLLLWWTIYEALKLVVCIVYSRDIKNYDLLSLAAGFTYLIFK